MYRQTSRLWGLFLVFLAATPMTAAVKLAVAADFLSVSVQHDGSIEPPGFLVSLRVVSIQPETELTFQTDAYDLGRLDKDGNPTAIPEELPTSRITPQRGESVAKIVIPYEALKLDNGFYNIAFQIVASQDNKVLFTCATEPVKIKVDDQRREIRTRTNNLTEMMTRSIGETSGVRNALGAVAWLDRQTTLAEAVSVARPTALAQPVDVPRGFRAIQMMAAAPNGATDRQTPWWTWQEQQIFFGTNREIQNANPTGVDDYLPNVAALSYGKTIVNVPIQNHVPGRIELPSWGRPFDRSKDFGVTAFEGLDETKFIGQLIPAFGDSKKDILVFVHGYNVKFEDALLRLAQFRTDVHFAGIPIAFVWPSLGTDTGYVHDGDVATSSHMQLAEMLRTLIAQQEKQGGQVHVLAHSMGNRILLNAIDQLNLLYPSPRKILGHVICAAPDVELNVFKLNAPIVIDRCKSFTLYFNPNDRALNVGSSEVNISTRAGATRITLPPGLDSVDASKVDSWFSLQHSYYGDVPRVIADLRFLLLYDFRAADRPLLLPYDPKASQVYFVTPESP